jgi:hypothetical protein
MFRQNFGVLGAVVVCLLTAQVGWAGDWEPVYVTDFSKDPGWSTNNAARYYWDSNSETYHFSNVVGQNEYSFKQVGYSQSLDYKLVFDITVTGCEEGSHVHLGLMEPDMIENTPSRWEVRYHHVGAGETASIMYYAADGSSYGPGQDQPFPFVDGNTYHNELIYDHNLNILTLQVTENGSPVGVGTQQLTGVGPFTGIDRLGFTDVGDTYMPGITTEGFIDNFGLYSVPEPGTLSLLAMGGLALLRRKGYGG